MTIAEFPPEPLPIVLEEAPDESLSSWLTRHAAFYGIAPSVFSVRVGIDEPTFARIDHWATIGHARSLARAMRRTPTMILSMTHQRYLSPLTAMIVRGEPLHACSECQMIHRRDNRASVVLRSWSHGWRITCPVCGSRLREATGDELHPSFSAFEHVWDEARTGEEMLANIDQLPSERAAFVVALLHLLLLRRSPTRNDAQRQLARGRVLDVVIPGFDDIDRHAPFTVRAGTPLVVPLAIRIALLAGLFRTQEDPSLYDRMQHSCSGRESIRFDAVTIKLLAEAHPAFSHLQQIRDSSTFWSRYFLQRKRKTTPISRFRTT